MCKSEFRGLHHIPILFLPLKIGGHITKSKCSHFTDIQYTTATERAAALFFVSDEVARFLVLAICTVHLHILLFVREPLV